jgi:DNA polymerase-3 subunit epsilon
VKLEEVLAFDTETTGVNIAFARIVTASLVRALINANLDDTNNVKIKNWLINPGVHIPEQSIAIHKITNELAQEKGEDPVIALESLSKDIATISKRGIPLVIFNASYDYPLLENELSRHSLPTLRERLGDVPFILDPLTLDRILVPRREGRRTLERLGEIYNLSKSGDLHSADVDSLLTIKVLKEVWKEHPELDNYTPEELMQFQSDGYTEWSTKINDHWQSINSDKHLPLHWL